MLEYRHAKILVLNHGLVAKPALILAQPTMKCLFTVFARASDYSWQQIIPGGKPFLTDNDFWLAPAHVPAQSSVAGNQA